MLCPRVTGETSVFMKLNKEESFNDKRFTNDMIGSYTLDNLMMCSSRCTSQALCVSLFYNKYTRLCQTHTVVFKDPTSSLVSVNTSYYYITDGNSVLEPIKDCEDPPTEAGVSWVTGTNYLGSRRQYSCVGARLPRVSDVQCLTTGNWTLMSDFCRDLESCEDVQTCSSTNADATYLLYPPVLGGQGVQIYCHNMAADPKAYVTLFEENMSRNDFSLRTWTFPCSFVDRDGDATAHFNKINVNLEDMSVDRADFTFADTCQETSDRSIPGFGEAAACSFDYAYRDYRQCPAPGVFIINTGGTGLKVRSDCTWSDGGGYGSRVEPVVWSSDGLKVQTTFDGWCGSFKPDTIYLEYSAISDIRGAATTPVCPPNYIYI
ncbi:A disintegrin and metalloproteinase with thrombospondin motifs gon-1-like [Pecten maximus]|uniref:A disintegrin and metalloproteinase with thrombospondin motifs gon-1-like n=1 Tax=Pecten maximus TaxID=6579 RepID=UPI001458F996|nr:A disintegrin and metalloproteinase with thrombospondin motifs gon-1-like [Pecten maximus]